MRYKRWLPTAGLCLGVFVALAAFKVMEIRAAIAFGQSFPEHSETVESALVKRGDYVPTMTVIGDVRAPRQLALRNELAGEVVGVHFESGGHVKSGQLLLQLDITIEQANLAAAEARTTQTRSVFERAQRLKQQNALSQEQLDKAKADLRSAQAEVNVLKRTIEKKSLRAPFAATAGLHQFEPGQYLEANTLITTLIGDAEEVWVDFKVPQFYSPLETGAAVTISPIGNSRGGVQWIGQVIAENTVLDPSNRSQAYRASIGATPQELKANTVVSVRVPIGSNEPVLSIPATALQEDALGSYVFLLNPEEGGAGFRAMRRQVKVRATVDNTVLIEVPNDETWLKEGDRVAAAGAFKLHQGLLVYVKERPEVGKSGALLSPAVSLPDQD